MLHFGHFILPYPTSSLLNISGFSQASGSFLFADISIPPIQDLFVKEYQMYSTPFMPHDPGK